MRTANSDSPTKEKLLAAAEGLMLAKGYTATSVDDVCAAAGVTKGSFFHYFEGKEHLGRLVAERFFNARKERFLAAPFRAKKDPLERIFGFLDSFAEMARSPDAAQGCLLGTFIQELAQTHPQIRDVCASCIEQQAAAFQRDLDEAKTKYAPRARWDTHSLAEHLIAVLQGSIILAKAKQDPTVIAEHAGHFKEYLKLLFGR